MQDEHSQPQPPEEISRREWMGKATISLGGVIGLTLAIPTMAALTPDVNPGRPAWTGMDENAWKQLQAATDTPVQIDIIIVIRPRLMFRIHIQTATHGWLASSTTMATINYSLTRILAYFPHGAAD